MTGFLLAIGYAVLAVLLARETKGSMTGFLLAIGYAVLAVLLARETGRQSWRGR